MTELEGGTQRAEAGIRAPASMLQLIKTKRNYRGRKGVELVVAAQSAMESSHSTTPTRTTSFAPAADGTLHTSSSFLRSVTLVDTASDL